MSKQKPIVWPSARSTFHDGIQAKQLAASCANSGRGSVNSTNTSIFSPPSIVGSSLYTTKQKLDGLTKDPLPKPDEWMRSFGSRRNVFNWNPFPGKHNSSFSSIGKKGPVKVFTERIVSKDKNLLTKLDPSSISILEQKVKKPQRIVVTNDIIPDVVSYGQGGVSLCISGSGRASNSGEAGRPDCSENVSIANEGYPSNKTLHTVQESKSKVVKTKVVQENRVQSKRNDNSFSPNHFSPLLRPSSAPVGRSGYLKQGMKSRKNSRSLKHQNVRKARRKSDTTTDITASDVAMISTPEFPRSIGRIESTEQLWEAIRQLLNDCGFASRERHSDSLSRLVSGRPRPHSSLGMSNRSRHNPSQLIEPLVPFEKKRALIYALNGLMAEHEFIEYTASMGILNGMKGANTAEVNAALKGVNETQNVMAV